MNGSLYTDVIALRELNFYVKCNLQIYGNKQLYCEYNEIREAVLCHM